MERKLPKAVPIFLAPRTHAVGTRAVEAQLAGLRYLVDHAQLIAPQIEQLPLESEHALVGGGGRCLRGG